jgi:chemotaxis signal transduction protein
VKRGKANDAADDLAERGLARLSAFLAARSADRHAAIDLAADGGSIVVLPFQIGPHALAIESTRVIEVRPGALVETSQDTARPTTRADLHALLRVPAAGAIENVIARADASVGRAPGPRVAFAVDGTRPLKRVPLEQLQPFPDVLSPKLETDVLVAVLDLRDHGLLFLLDPERLARAASPAVEG